MTKAKLITVLVAAAVLCIVLVLVVRYLLSGVAITVLVSVLAGFVIGVLASFFILRRGKPAEPHRQP